MVLYWYENLSYINATIFVSQTECKPVTIDPCLLKYPCTDRELCSYLKSKTDTFGFRYILGHLRITYLKSKCVILVLESNVVTKLESQLQFIKIHHQFIPYCPLLVAILDSLNLVTQVKFKVPPVYGFGFFRMFYEEIAAVLPHEQTNDRENCTDIACNIKSSKLSTFKVYKVFNISRTYFRDVRVCLEIELYIILTYLDTGWIDIIIRNDSSSRSITETVPFSSDVLLSPPVQYFAYTWNSMRTVFLSISCHPLDYSTLSGVSIMVYTGEQPGKYC